MKFKMIVLVTLVSLGLSSTIVKAAEVTGQITAVNEEQETILLREGPQKTNQYRLSFETKIRLNQKQVNLQALQPIDYKSFCEAKLKLNPANKVVAINAAYQAVEVIVTAVKNKNLQVKKVNTGLTRKFKLIKDVAITRNNVAVNANDISEGDKGLVILGLDNQLQKVILFNYQVYGLLKKRNSKTREIVLNVGSRLKPEYKKFNVPPQVKIRYQQQAIDFGQLTANMWVKIELDDKIRRLVVRKI